MLSFSSFHQSLSVRSLHPCTVFFTISLLLTPFNIDWAIGFNEMCLHWQFLDFSWHLKIFHFEFSFFYYYYYYVASVVSDSVRPRRRQPTRLPHPWDSPGKNTGVGCHFLLQCMKVKSGSEVAQSCLTLRDPMDCSLPGSSAHGIFQARVLEWGAIASPNSLSGFSKKCKSDAKGNCHGQIASHKN